MRHKSRDESRTISQEQGKRVTNREEKEKKRRVACRSRSGKNIRSLILKDATSEYKARTPLPSLCYLWAESNRERTSNPQPKRECCFPFPDACNQRAQELLSREIFGDHMPRGLERESTGINKGYTHCCLVVAEKKLLLA